MFYKIYKKTNKMKLKKLPFKLFLKKLAINSNKTNKNKIMLKISKAFII